MTTVLTCKIGESKGVPRIWLEGEKLARAGVSIGSKYRIRELPEDGRLELIPLAESTASAATCKVSKRVRKGIIRPLMEIRTALLSTLFSGMEKVRVAIRKGRIVVTALRIEVMIRERVRRLQLKLAAKEKLNVVSLFHGGGVIDKALHVGLMAAGVASVIQLGVEKEPEYLESSLRNNSEIWAENSIAACSDIRDLDLVEYAEEQTDLLWAGVPCTGASIAGVAKNKLEFAEEHSEVGSLFVDYLEAVKLFNPAITLLENVTGYQKSASMAVIRSKLESYGYVLYEEVLDGNDFGALEGRSRLVMVAISRGLETDFSFDHLRPVAAKPETLGEILEDVPLDSLAWKSYDYLVEKELRDKAEGKGFARTLVTPDSTRVPTVTKTYAKAQSTGIFLKHPFEPKLTRLLTEVEHARVKGIPLEMIAGLSATVAHEVLGQSVVFPLFVSLGRELGLAMNLKHRDTCKVLEFRSGKATRSFQPDCVTESEVEFKEAGELIAVRDARPMYQQQLFEFDAA